MNFITSSPFKFLLVILYVAFATHIVSDYNGNFFTGIDDANIYMVYMRNFANGHGFVYNIGGENVEGFTSLLWTLIGSIFYKFTQTPELYLLVFNMLIVTYTLWKFVVYIDNLKSTKTILSIESLALLTLLLLMPGFFEWTILSLMETGLWFSLLSLATLHIITQNSKTTSLKTSIEFSILLILLLLCRPEAMLWTCVLIAFFGIKTHYAKPSTIKTSLKSVIPYGYVVIATLGLLTSWRLWYFGFPFPNTYYAKVSSSLTDNIDLGWQYVIKAINYYPILLIILFITLPFIFIKRHKVKLKIKQAQKISYGIFIIALLIPFLTGGDHFGYARFYQPTLVIGLLALFISLVHLKLGLRVAYIILLVGYIFMYSENNLIDNITEEKSAISYEWLLAKQGRKRSKDLNTFFKNLEKLPSQGVLLAGSHAYTYKGFTNDLLGLNNIEMAHKDNYKDKALGKNHASFNTAVFYKQKPDVFWYGSAYISAKDTSRFKIKPSRIQKRVFKNIHKDHTFKHMYSPVILTHKNVGYALKIMASNSFLETLKSSEYTIIHTEIIDN